MKLTVVLLLVAGQLTVQVLGKDDLCEDSDSFHVVDMALTNYNKQRSSGHQFILYRILSASVKGQAFQVTYEIRESNCDVKEDKNWKECGYKDSPEMDQGLCTVMVDIQDERKFHITEQSCHITPVHDFVREEKYPCVGCFHPIPTNSSTVKSLLRSALQFVNEKSNRNHLFVLKEVLNAKSQVVNGVNYDIQYSVVESDCSKNEDDHSKCRPLPQGQLMVCNAQIYVDINMNVTISSQDCNPVPHFVPDERVRCHGCFHPKLTNSSNVKSVLESALQYFNKKSNHNHLFVLKEVLNAKSQVVSGVNYDLRYTIVESDCSKNEDDHSECSPLPQGEVMICHDQIYVDINMKVTIRSQICNPVLDSLFFETEEMSVDSPMLREPLRESLKKFNEEIKSDFYFKIDTILEARSTVEFGPRYIITFNIKETECSKEKDKISEHCAPKESGDVLKCIANVSVEATGTFNPTVDCREPQMAFLRRPPGFSPFRSLSIDMDSLWYERGPNTGHWKRDHPGRGLGLKHGHGHHKGHHKYKHGQGHWKHGQRDKENHESWTNKYGDNPTGQNSPSSMTQEETQGSPPLNSPSLQRVTVSPLDFQDSDLLPSNPTNPPSDPSTEEEKEEIKEEEDFLIPDIPVEPKSPLFPLVPDFPEPSASKCPGRPWKPIKQILQLKPFILSDALESQKK